MGPSIPLRRRVTLPHLLIFSYVGETLLSRRRLIIREGKLRFWEWNNVESVRAVHSSLEGWALVFFALLVLFDVLAHRTEHGPLEKRFERIGLWFFGVAVLAEILAYPYGQRNDTLSSHQDLEQRAKIAGLDNSTQGLRTDAENSRKQAEGFKSQIADADARVKAAEAQVAVANAASKDAVAKVAAADARSAQASAKAEGFRLDIARANESAKQAEAQAVQATLELARFRAPRTLSVSQQASIAARLRVHGARRVDVIIIGDGREIGDVTDNIVAAARQAGWVIRVIGKAISGPNVSGVLVGTHLGSTKDVSDAADTLISALQAAGIVSGRFAPQFDDELPMALMGTWDKNNVAPIRMLISAKP